MFFRVFLLFALVAAAFASPKAEPQAFAYGAPAAIGYTGYTGYAGYASPYAYSAPYVPYAYGGYYVR